MSGNEYLQDPENRKRIMAHDRALINITITWQAAPDQPLPVEPGFIVDVEPDTGLLPAVRCLHCGDITWVNPAAVDPGPTLLTDWLLGHDCRKAAS